MPTRHSNVVGGSTCARFVNCPGHLAVVNSLPAVVDTPTEYATEGTALHNLIADLITGAVRLSELVPDETEIETHEGPVLLTQELLHDCIIPALAFWQSLAPTLEDYLIEAEALPFPGITGAFGTCDLAGITDDHRIVHVVDWKFGAGVDVKAVYPADDPDYETINEQLLFYACCLLEHRPAWFRPDTIIRLTIFQPRSRDGEPISQTDVRLIDLKAFIMELAGSLEKARAGGAALKLGHWCRFAPCRTACPLQREALIDLADLVEPAGGLPAVKALSAEQHTGMLCEILEKAPMIEHLIEEARRQASLLLQNGGTLPGWKLVRGRSQRRWQGDPPDIQKALLKHYRLKKAQIFNQVLKSPAQVEKLLKRGVKLPPELAAAPPGALTLTRANDSRPAELMTGEILGEIASEVVVLEKGEA